MAKCRFPILDRDGNESVLQQELEADKDFGERGALLVMLDVKDALASGKFGSRSMRANGEPTVAQVKELLSTRELDPLTAVMVNADKIDRLKEIVGSTLAAVNLRLERYKDPKAGGSAIAVSDKARKELRGLQEKLKGLNELEAYVALVEFADKQLREYRDFMDHTFDAKAAADTDGGNMHPAALDEIRVQLKSYEDVFQPELAKEYSALRDVLVGRGNILGLQRMKEELEEKLNEGQLAYHTELSKKLNNRQGLSDEQIQADIKAGTDVTALSKALSGASQSSNRILSLINAVVDFAKLRGRDLGIALGITIKGADDALRKAGVTDFGWMLGLDGMGKADGSFLQKIGKQYWDNKRELRENLEAAGDYYEGRGLTKEQREHNIVRWKASRAQTDFNNAEFIDSNGVASDGVSHRYTAAFKATRSQFEELRKNGKRWEWSKKIGVDEEAYGRYMAKYYGEKVYVKTMITEKVGGVRVPTGEVQEQEMRFTNRAATTEVVEELWRDPKYATLLADKSKMGEAKLTYYNFFTQKMDEYVRILPKEDAENLRKGQLPAVMASVMGRYNGKLPGWSDYMGKVVTNPIGAIKDAMPAAQAGRDSVRVKEDGTLSQDVRGKKYTGGFYSENTVKRLEGKLLSLDQKSPTYGEDKKALERSLTIERNRPRGSQVETDLSKLLHAFGAMALNYKELKQQEGTINLLRDAIKNRTFYEEKDGKVVLSEGKPVEKPGTYSSQVAKQTEDWLNQNYLQEVNLGKSQSEALGRAFKQYISITFQGMNYAAALKNITAGNIANRIYAAGGLFGWDKKVANRALLEVTSQGAKIGADILAEHLEGAGLVLHPKNSKVDAIMATYGLMEHESKMNGSNVLNTLAFAGTTVGEYHIQSQLAVAKLMSTPVVGLDGETKMAYDVLSLANGKLHVDPNYEAAWEKMRHRVTLDVRNIIKHTQGNHSSEDKVALEKEWMGAMVLQFKRWAYNGFKNRWGRASYDEGIGVTTEGYYRGMLRLAKAAKALGIRAGAYASLSDHDKALVQMALQEMKYIVGLLGLLLIVGALKPEPDDDDMHLLYLGTNLAERVLSGTRGELDVFLNPLESYNLFKNPAASLGMVRDMGVFLKNVTQVPYYGLSGNADKLDYQTGSRKGQSKLWKSTKDLIPILRMDRIYEQLQTTGQPWIQ